MVGNVRESVNQVDDKSWLISDKFILRRQTSAPGEYLWKDGDCFWYTVQEASDPLPQAGPLPPDSHIRQVHDADDSSAVWSFGDAFLKVKLTVPQFEPCTKEHVTLAWLAKQQDRLSFAVPKVLYHTLGHDRSYLLVSRVPGTVLADVWRGLGEGEKQHYVGRVVEICKELSVWRSSAIAGIDGRQLFDTCDLGPHNIMVNSDGKGKGSVGSIDWEMAGYVPLEWVRTKFAISWAMDFAWPEVPGGDPSEKEWRERAEQRFGEEGYPEVQETYKKWMMERRNSKS